VIVVDRSVWIDFLKGRNVPHVRRLPALLGTDEIIVGDLMLCEVLQELESEPAARDVEALLRRFEIVPMAGDRLQSQQPAIFVPCAGAASPSARRIGTWCIKNRRALLHNDGDFRPMTRHLGLIELPARHESGSLAGASLHWSGRMLYIIDI
jgi:hypothetical protein